MTKLKTRRQHEWCNILKGELDGAIDSYVPMKNQLKRYKKKHLSKEAFQNINKICGGFINIRERINIMLFTNRN